MPHVRSRSATLPDQLFAALNIAVLERQDPNTFLVLGTPPTWLLGLWPSVVSSEAVDPAEAFFFLEHFLFEAEAHWTAAQASPLCSGTWTEMDEEGRAWLLEAEAMTIEGRDLLLIRFPTTRYDTMQHVLQQSRQQALEHEHLLKEINKREVLLHCIIHDLSTPLAGVKGSLTVLVEDQMIQDEGLPLARIGMNQVGKMQRLIKQILTTFSDEVQVLLPTFVDEDTAPDVLPVAHDVAQALQATAALERVRFHIEAPQGVFKVVGEPTRLERVLFNLVDNALRYSEPNSTVTIRLIDEGTTIRVSVEDEGAGVPPEEVDTLFSKFSQGVTGQSGTVGLGLYFCRLTVEDWGGQIGYSPSSSGGASFWFRLPKPPPAA